jgi:PAS domain S-box-containing protein
MDRLGTNNRQPDRTQPAQLPAPEAGTDGDRGTVAATAAAADIRPPIPMPALWRSIVPPGLVLLVGALALHTHVYGVAGPLSVGADVAVVAAGALMLLRQAFAARDSNRLWSRLAAAYDQLDRGHRSLAELHGRLRASEEHYRRIVETTDEGVWMLDADDRTSYVSRRMAAMLGYEPHEMTGRPVLEFTDEAGRPRLVASMRKRRQGVGEQYDGRLLRRDGSEQWVQVTASPFFDADGRYAGALGMVSDITRRRQAEQTLRFQKALLESQSETSIDGVLVVSPDGRMLSFNRRFVEIWRMPADVRAGRMDERSLQWATSQVADPGAFLARVAHLYAHPEETGRDEFRMRDGRVIDRYTAPLRGGADGTYFGRVWYFRDVTEQRRAQEALRVSEERFRLACRASNGVIWDLDLTTGRVERGEAVEAVFGYPPAEVAPTPQWWSDHIHPEDGPRVESLVGRALGGADRSIAVEYRFRRRDGSYAHVLDRAWIMRDGGGRPVRLVGAMIDLTERRRAEALDRERGALMEAVASMEQVLGVVGHELRTPLAGIRAMSEFLMLDGAAAAKGAEFLGAINSEVVRLSDTVDDLLEAARLNSGRARWNWSTFPLARPCDEALANVRPLLEGTAVALEGSVEPAGLEMSGDADAVRRLLLNLLSNARKHTHAGHIRVGAAAHRDAAGQWVRLTIEDTGEGIAPEILARVGEPFALIAGVVGANYVKGAGLGLAICKAIVLAHGGTFAVRSEPGAGTAVEVLLRADLPGPVVAGGKTAWGALPGPSALTAAEAQPA